MTRHTRRTIFWTLSLATFAALPALAQDSGMPPAAVASDAQARAPEQNVPVTTVMLFSSGVGYFEHAGSVTGDGSTTLRFNAEQVNDILKSLVLQDTGGGVIGAVTYPSQDPIDKTLRSFQIDISGNPSLADLLNQLRGARVTVTAGDRVTGIIVGVEKKTVVVENKSFERAVLNILSEGGVITSIELDGVSNLQLEDRGLQEELGRALAALAGSRDQSKKPVTIDFRGQGQRDVRIGYVVQTPVWKTSYRLILSEEEQAGRREAPAEPRLQGWAIVENQTDNDWANVNLSLVSGRPISFIMDLYQPLYIPRPIVVPELYESLRPKTYEEGQSVFAGGAAAIDGGDSFATAGSLAHRRDAPAAAPPMQQRGGVVAGKPIDPSSSVQSVASAQNIGELFSYTVGSVSLARQKSAMLPIITDPIKVERLSIYNAATLQKHPLNGARVTNTTDKHLLAGPVTVLDGGAYAGDAQIDNLPPGQNRLLSYGIDLQMRVDSTKENTDSTVLSGRITQGVLWIQRKYVWSQTYQAENKSPKDRTLMIEHPLRQNWKLVDSPSPEETTETVYRFKSPVAAGKQASVTINQEMVSDESIAILPLDMEQILVYSRTGQIPDAVRDALVKAAEFKRALSTTERQIRESEVRVSQITQEQNRIRENMKTVDNKSEYYTRLLKKLNEQESQIEQLQTQRDELRTTADKQRAELEAYINGLNVG